MVCNTHFIFDIISCARFSASQFLMRQVQRVSTTGPKRNEYQQFMLSFFQSNPDISQRMTEFRISDNALAVASSSRSVASTSTTHTLRSLCESVKLDIVLNSIRVSKVANRNRQPSRLNFHPSLSFMTGASLKYPTYRSSGCQCTPWNSTTVACIRGLGGKMRLRRLGLKVRLTWGRFSTKSEGSVWEEERTSKNNMIEYLIRNLLIPKAPPPVLLQWCQLATEKSPTNTDCFMEWSIPGRSISSLLRGRCRPLPIPKASLSAPLSY